MRRPRGPGGRFLTAEEIAAQKAAAPEAEVARDDDDDPAPSPVSPDLPRPVVSQPPAQSQPPAPVPTLAPAPPPPPPQQQQRQQQQLQQQSVTQLQAGHRATPVNLVNIPYHHKIQSQQSQLPSLPALYQEMCVHSQP